MNIDPYINLAREQYKLSKVETVELAYILAGTTVNESAEVQGLKPSSIQSRRCDVFEKLGVKRASEATAKVLGIVMPEPRRKS